MTFRLSRLALLLALSIVVTSVFGVAATWWVAEQEFREVLNDDLENQSKLLAEILTSDDFDFDADKLAELLEDLYESDDEDAIWVTIHDLDDGTSISNIEHQVALAGDSSGSISMQFDGYGWHGYQEEDDGIVVQMLRRTDLYRDVLEESLEDIVMPALIGGGITLTLLLVLIGFSLWPVMRLARQLEERSPDSLAPLAVRTPAREIRQLGDSVNKLIHDVESVLQRERQFASDVAHELRNPLTTFAVELGSDDPDIDALKAESRRLARLVEQLLTLARLEQRHWHRRFEPVELDVLCTRVIGQLSEKFATARIDIESRLTPVAVQGDTALLDTLCRNLLLNILNHCPPGTSSLVEVKQDAAGTHLRISDTGPGIDAQVRAQMTKGFTRLDSRSEGFGLGLAICHRIAEVHDASVVFSENEDGSSGLVVDVAFPAQPASVTDSQSPRNR